MGMDGAQPVARPFERFELHPVVGHFVIGFNWPGA
jgi:hypothetical protein